MKILATILSKLENHLQNGTFEEMETDVVEIKNMPAGKNDKEFNSIKESICSFLNTRGGILIIGVKEEKNPRKYVLTGYNQQFEETFKKLSSECVTDRNGNWLDISEYLYFEITDCLDKQIIALYVDKLPEEKKYAFFNGKAYERKLTGDHEIAQTKILAHEEYLQEISNARELYPVIGANINDFDVDKLNEYIFYLNREIKIESPKASIEDAKAFLLKKHFITNEGEPTTLGLLVCGKDTEHFLGTKCQVDCFVESPVRIAQNKKILKDNVLSLLENSFSFVYRNIQVGVSTENGGTSVPEYPENLIRESINNSLAHRDYTIDKYININISPNKHIEIRNPGRFKKSLLIESQNHEIQIRRLIPNPKAINPKLADVLKVYDKWEGKGIGMATLTNECLANKIDLPFYKFYDKDDLALFIPSGKLLDDKMEAHLKMYDKFLTTLTDGEELTKEQKIIVAYLYKSEIQNEKYNYTILLTQNNNHFNALNFLKKTGVIYEHPISDAIHPVFVLHRELMKTNFNTELRAIFGAAYDNLTNEYKTCLRVIYQYNTYSKAKFASANMVSNTLYFRENDTISDFKKYDNFKRKVRNMINQLETKKFIIKHNESSQYHLNREFNLIKTLF